MRADPPSPLGPTGDRADGGGLGLHCRAIVRLHESLEAGEVVTRLFAGAQELLSVTGLALLSLHPGGRTVRLSRVAGAVWDAEAQLTKQGLTGASVTHGLLAPACDAGASARRRVSVRCGLGGPHPALLVAWLHTDAAWTAAATATLRLLGEHATIALHSAELHAAAAGSAQLREEFSAIVSHEMRTPLNAVIGFTELLLHGALDPVTDNQRGALTEVLAAAHEMLERLDRTLGLGGSNGGERQGSFLR